MKKESIFELYDKVHKNDPKPKTERIENEVQPQDVEGEKEVTKEEPATEETPAPEEAPAATQEEGNGNGV